MSKIVTVKTEADFKTALAGAKGQVALEFVMKDCSYCDEEKPKVEAIAEACEGLTVIRADVEDLPELADAFQCEGTPTIYFAKKPEDLTPSKSKELDDSSALARRIKCARPIRGA